MLLEHSIDRRYVQNAIGPTIGLLRSSRLEAPAGCLVEGIEALDKQAFQVFDLHLTNVPWILFERFFLTFFRAPS